MPKYGESRAQVALQFIIYSSHKWVTERSNIIHQCKLYFYAYCMYMQQPKKKKDATFKMNAMRKYVVIMIPKH
jgi:hypothetical protein